MAASASQNISLNSTVTVTYAGGNYYSRTSNTASGSLSFSVSVPSGATNVSATLYYNYNSSYSGAKVNGQACSQGAGYIHLGAVSSANVNFSFKAFCESYSKGPPTSTVTRTASWSAYLAVTWDGDDYIGDPGGGATPGEPGGTIPPTDEIWNLYLNGVMGATPSDIVYSNAGAAATLSWSADDTRIAVWQIHRKVNGGAYTYLQSIAWQARSATVYAAPAGSMYQYMVIGVYAESYGGGYAGYAYSPTIISRSAVSVPAWCSVSPATRYPGESTTLSWGASSGGVGTSVTSYHIYRNGVYFAATTGTSYIFAAPSAGSYLFQIYAIANISGYNNGPSPGAGLTVANPKSTGVLNKSTVPMDDTSTITLTVTPGNITYNHKAVWFLGAKTWTDTLATDITESTLTVPLDWCEAVPNAVSGTASVRLETYNGGTLVGSNTYTFTATVPAWVVPTVSLSAAPVTGFNGLYIQGISKAKLTATAAGAQGSTIANYAFTGSGYSGSTNPWTTTGTLNYAGITPIKVIVTDSRGRQASATVNITVEAYAVPVIGAVTAYRSDASGNAQDEGTNIAAIAPLIVSPVTGNSGTATVRMRPVGGDWLASKPIEHTTLTVLTGTAQDIYAYDVEITLTDTIGKTTVYSVTVPMVKQLYEWKMDRAGIGRLAGPNTKTLILPEDWTTNIVSTRISNKNILHNWDFHNPVNQRAVSGAISTPGYFYDRWYLNYGTVTIGADYVVLESGTSIWQPIEGTWLAGKTCTVSIADPDGNIYAYTITLPVNDGYGVAASGRYEIISQKTPGSIIIIITNVAGGVVYTSAVKLELGTVSTLAYDPPMDHAVELPKCQRFFRVISTQCRYWFDNYFIFYGGHFSPQMRIYPTVINPTLNIGGGGGDKTVTSVTCSKDKLVNLQFSPTGDYSSLANAGEFSCWLSSDL